MAKHNAPTEQDRYTRKRKLLAIISIVVVVILLILLTLFIWNWLSSFSTDGFRDYIQSFGPVGWLVLLGLQILQVFVALIPGELLETAAGYCFGPVLGTLICYVGITIATVLVFLLASRFGVRLVEIFISKEKINELRFLNTEKKRNLIVFLIFFIPGTPKDLLTYFVPLTNMKLGTFLVISLIARIPSVLSSSFGGHLLGEGKYWGAILIYGIIAVLSFIGLTVYNRIVRRKQEKISD